MAVVAQAASRPSRIGNWPRSRASTLPERTSESGVFPPKIGQVKDIVLSRIAVCKTAAVAMSSLLDKLLHFAIGLGVGVVFWAGLERYHRAAARVINPLVFLIMVVWGASGLFLFRQLGIPLLSHTAFYMAVPDWDLPLYKLTRFRFLIHRSWPFHSVLIPLLLLGLWLWLSRQPGWHRWQRVGLSTLRDGAIGLSVGMSAHLIWDALLSSTRRGFYIHGFSRGTSLLWLLINLTLGLGVPFVIARALSRTSPVSSSE
ncbi:MAG: hypothetical protein AAF773_14455 [Cyanobacteria bacterium P01_D01_bin.115]